MAFNVFDLVIDSLNKDHQFLSDSEGGGDQGKGREREQGERKGKPCGGGRLTVSTSEHRNIDPFYDVERRKEKR